MKRHVTRVLALMLIAAVGLSRSAGAQSGPTEGIKVHGRWTIEVRNPDGTLVSRNDFENALVPGELGGASALAGILGRHFVAIDHWRIHLRAPAGTPHPCGGSVPCQIVEQTGGGAPSVGGLIVQVPLDINGGPTGALRLVGSARATVASSIATVGTFVNMCVDLGCLQRLGRTFTAHQLAVPISVVPNQLIEVTVVFSFS